MNRAGWHLLRDENALTLARRLPVRFDVSVGTSFPVVRMLPLAHQIRQDVWRALQRVRGFSPVVRIVRDEGEMHVTAGGRIDFGQPCTTVADRLREVLEHPGNRTRWIRWAQ